MRLAYLLLLDGYGNFMKCHLATGRVLLMAETMKHMESLLPAGQFVRLHKSYLANLAHVERLSGNLLLMRPL